MTRARSSGLAVGVAIVTIVWLLLPPAAERLALPADPLIARGALHVHTVRSDGAGTPERVAGAAHRAGLDFVVLTDHGDATRAPDRPRYVEGVLLIDAVEISTTEGHLIALGLPQAPYRLAGEARDVLEDVHRLGGFGIAAHPDSPKAELQWRDWESPVDGIEWLNVDSEWRDESRTALSRAVLTYWFRPAETLASLLDRSSHTFERWDELAVVRPVVAVAGLDAHARIPLAGQTDVNEGRSIGLPSYESSFRAVSQSVVLAAPLGRTAASAPRDASAVLSALRDGNVYTVVDGLAGPARLDFHGLVDGARIEMGKSITGGRPVQLVATLIPPVHGSAIVLIRNGRELARTNDGARLARTQPPSATPEAYRVEVRLPEAPGTPPMPWVVGNPIFVGLPSPSPPEPERFMGDEAAFDGTLGKWTIEHARSSEGRVELATGPSIEKPALHFTWRLADGPPSGQYAALVLPIRGAAGETATDLTDLFVTANSPRPMRLSVQVRIPEGGGLRWQRSIYLDGSRREPAVIALRDMKAIEAPPGTPLDLSRVDTLLFVVDTVNAKPGSSGEVWISDARWKLRCCVWH
jgi:hypothetical protein